MALNKPSKEILVDKVNEDWKKNFDPAAVEFENVEAQPYDAEKNTGVTIKSAIGNEPIAEPINLYYDRVKLAELLDYRLGTDNVIEIADAGQLTKAELLADINAALHTELELADIQDGPLPSSGLYPRDVIIKAATDSLIYTGQIPLVITGTNPEPPPEG